MRVKITSYERKKRDVGQDAGDTIDQRLHLKLAAMCSANSVIGREATLILKCERYVRDIRTYCTCTHASLVVDDAVIGLQTSLPRWIQH